MPPDDETTAADQLLTEVATDPWGTVAVSLYDTARLVALAPWLAGHQARIDFLCRRQGADGGWGGPDGYGLVPTLSATTALLTELRRRPGPAGSPRLVRAAAAGRRALRRWLHPDAQPAVPDTIGVELIVPALVEELTALTTPAGPAAPEPAAPPRPAVPTRPARPPVASVPAEVAAPPVRLPAGFDPDLLARARARFAAGAAPPKSWACLEVFGPAAAGAPFVRPAGGSVGCSPAATAAWLGGAHRHPEAVGFLDRLQARGGGPVPAVTPITYFEAAWVLNQLALAGLTRRVPLAVLDRLDAALTDAGAPAAAGLPADADDTAAVLAALLRHGRLRRPDPLLPYRTDGYFTCFPDERSPSVSTNAHVLETLALYLARRPTEHPRFAGPAATAADWLLGQQRSDGSWWDKWHASPYYATACCVVALALHGGRGARPALTRAVSWVRATQRPDGSWGRWQGTVEETAYGVQVLAFAGPAGADPDPTASAAAAARAHRFLADPPPLAEHPPLWHAKDLYTPVAVVRAARLAALRLAAGWRDPRATPGRPRR
jgi:hypothetical protein